ncbi:hypothetical protein SUGI_0442510 [Cryptomeria japonica]|nr:hypothetical protein SUGI_0442510 [Cryptomeria japonica]
MGTFYDEFSNGIDLYSGFVSPLISSQDVYQMGIMEDVQYGLATVYDASESSWNSSSSENLLTLEGFDQQSVNSWPDFEHSVFAQTAFMAYRKTDSNAPVDPFKSCQTLHKRCFNLLCKIDEKMKLERQISRPIAPAPSVSVPQKKRSAAEHMIAERGRRIRFKQHFSNLYSLLPRNSKNSRNSILANTTTYVKELKLRVAELEHHNRILQASVPSNISINDKACSGFESHKQSISSESTIIYSSNEVTLEQCKKIPCLVNIKTTMQIDLITCPTSVLMKQLERLKREQVEILSIDSSTKPFQFRSNILVKPKGHAWNISMWQNLGNIVRESLF